MCKPLGSWGGAQYQVTQHIILLHHTNINKYLSSSSQFCYRMGSWTGKTPPPTFSMDQQQQDAFPLISLLRAPCTAPEFSWQKLCLFPIPATGSLDQQPLWSEQNGKFVQQKFYEFNCKSYQIIAVRCYIKICTYVYKIYACIAVKVGPDDLEGLSQP